MNLLEEYIAEAARDNEKNNIRYYFLGDKDGLGEKFSERCKRLEKMTENNKFILNIALNYGSRAEITTAVNKLLREGREMVTEADISRLYIPPIALTPI